MLCEFIFSLLVALPSFMSRLQCEVAASGDRGSRNGPTSGDGVLSSAFFSLDRLHDPFCW